MRPTTSGDTDRDEFLRDAEKHRRELIAHCYRMTGSLHEAEDLVQETFLRAWRSWDSFEGRSSARSWLYRIATNLCLTALSHNQRRFLPFGLGPGEPNGSPADPRWIEPFPTDPQIARADPAEIAATRSNLRLAVVASLQHLPPRQRAVLILREVLAYPAAEVADILDMSIPAVKSALQRARATLDEAAPEPDVLAEPDSPRARAVLDKFIDAFENADIPALTVLLHDDATIEAIPTGTRVSGKHGCIAHLENLIHAAGGRFRLYPTSANGGPAAIAYHRAHPGDPFTPFAVVALAVGAERITAITAFLDPDLFPHFGFAHTVED
ncbi:sigma-70 family RNA polymerase sigma factor [Nocardia aurantia]|uniref:RNA polymerase sigma factor n=1 Tax=Nocardia aurantia TaxID=2585199 RepID=A0A7K0DSX4_9NOCA|nr:sigma-70 family RNA polymerase sigma factor [Nocardia aurantia]MQY28875.1 ECF RNA polymerase sigma factor SigG [Nocardia aurantia]